MSRVFISRDMASVALGADAVAAAFVAAGAEVIRIGSHGLFRIEPLVEVETPKGRIGFGPVGPDAVAAVLDAKGDEKFIVCNADEGDSGTFADRMLMEGDPYCLIEGMAIAAHAVGAGHGYVYIRSEYPFAVATMREAIARSAPRIAPFTLEIRVGAGAYVCGEETALLDSIEGKRGQVRAKPPLPAIAGLFGKPTVINNVLSLAAVPFILANGAEAYAETGFGRSRGTMPIQLAGNVKNGGLCEIGFGVTLGELVDTIGGGTESGRPVRAVQVGGPLGAYFPPSVFHLPFDYEAFSAAGGLIGHAGITVFDDGVDMAHMARFAMEFCAVESCGKCTPCRIGSTRGVEVIDRIIEARNVAPYSTPLPAGEGQAAQQRGVRASGVTLTLPSLRSSLPLPPGEGKETEIALLRDLCDTMKFGSLCALGGFTPYPVLSALDHFPEDFGGATALPVAAE